MYGFFGALYLLIAGVSDSISSRRKGKESAAKLQQHFDELERVRKEGEAKMQRSIERMQREDEERRKSQEAGEDWH